LLSCHLADLSCHDFGEGEDHAEAMLDAVELPAAEKPRDHVPPRLSWNRRQPAAAVSCAVAFGLRKAGNRARASHETASDARPAIMPKILPKTVRSQSLKFNVFCGFRAV
jgi:hypothetical protein